MSPAPAAALSSAAVEGAGPGPQAARDRRGLALWTCLLVASAFWIWSSVTVVSRWELLRHAVPAMQVPSASVMFVQCALLYPVLLALGTVSWRVGYGPTGWRRRVAGHAALAVLFGLCARPALILALALVDGRPVAETFMRANTAPWPQLASAYGSALLEDAAQYVFLQILLAGTAFYVRLRDEEAAHRRLAALYDRARLQALRMQTQPHFLFNTLGAIAGLIRTRPAAAETMVTHLGDLLRSTLADRDAEFVRLEDEVALGIRYLEIQRIRFEDRLSYRLDVGPEVRELRIPPLLLQPLLENAVEHGLASQDGTVRVDLDACRDGEYARVRLANRWGGAASHARRGGGFGLENVRARIEAAYGGAAIFTAGPCTAGVYVVELRVPWPAG